MTAWFASQALLPDGIAQDVLIEVGDGRVTRVEPGADAGTAQRLRGLVIPGLANSHSHAFHRALRGRTHDGGGTFWTWRQRMYALAATLDPDTYLDLARATYAEMALAGWTSVAEFHYLHHDRDGRRYADPNEVANVLHQAAADAGIRLTLLDVCYLAGGLDAAGHTPPDPVQRRFADADVEAWRSRAESLRDGDGFRWGVAAHSVRAVPREALPTVAAAAPGRPHHVHLSEQPAENDAALAHYGRTPTELLAEAGLLGPTTTAVHATHLTRSDIELLGRSRSVIAMCPSTERDLADGIGPARSLSVAGCVLSLGSDQHATLDPFDEARGLEHGERLASGRRGRFTPDELWAALTRHDSLGWPDAGRIAVGGRADLVAVRTDSVRTAGSRPEQVLFSATAADVDTVIVDGAVVVDDGRHRLGDVGRLLADAVGRAWHAAGL